MTDGVSRPRHREVVVILAGVSAALHVGKLSPALPVLKVVLDISLVQAGFLLSMVQLAGMLLGLAIGLGADYIGLKRCMVAGLVLLSVAGAAGGWVRDITSLLALRALEGVGLLLVTMPAPGLIRRLVAPERLSVALGLWGSYMPLGTAGALLTGPLVLDAFGWPVWWWSLAGLSLALALCVRRLVPDDRQPARVMYVNAPKSSIDFAEAGVWAARLRRTVTSRGPWLVALGFAVYSSQWLAVIGFLPSIVAHDGASSIAAAAPLALASAVNVVGNIVSGRLLQRGVPAHLLLYVGFCAMAIGALVAFADFPSEAGASPIYGVRYAGVLVFSMLGGMIPGTLFSLAVVLAPDESSISATVGWMQQCSAMGQLSGPPLVAWVASKAGGWHWTWVVTGLLSSLGLFVARQIAREVRR